MSSRGRAITLLVVQCLLVASIAAKYLYERATCPRVWVRVGQYDPNLPMRGRYFALSPLVNACSLPHDDQSATVNLQEWRVRTYARNGKLVVEDARNVLPRTDTQTIWLPANRTCENAPLSHVDFFVPDTARSPFPLKPGQELWAEVTVPPAGPPRPIQLAISQEGEWKPLPLN